MPKKIENDKEKVKYGLQATFTFDERDDVLRLENRIKKITAFTTRAECIIHAYGHYLQHISVETAQKKGLVAFHKKDILKGQTYESK